MPRPIHFVTRCLMLAALAACGGDESTGPDGLLFDELPPDLLAAYCVRGTATVGDTRSGTIAFSDCDAAEIDPDDDSYFEIWRVRVAQSRTVTFDLSSAFDNYLEVFRLLSHTETSASVALLDDNDDRSPDDLNALLSVELDPGVDYFVVVSGYDYGETGPYTLVIR